MMLVKVIAAEYIEEYKINVSFNDGSKGVIDLKNELWGSVFLPLKEVSEFKKFKLDNWTICWDNGADLAPEFLKAMLENNKTVVAVSKHPS